MKDSLTGNSRRYYKSLVATTLVILKLAVSVPSLLSAEEVWNMGIEKRVTDLEKRVEVLEGKAALWNQGSPAICPCPLGGKCICPANNCPCPNCPEHKKTGSVGAVINGIEWKGTTPTNKGRELLFFGSSTCVHCPAAISRLGELSKQIYYIDCSEGGGVGDTLARMYRVDSYPTLIAIDNGIQAEGLYTEGDSVGSFLAGKWLGITPASNAPTVSAKASSMSGKVLPLSSPAKASRVVLSIPRVSYTSSPSRSYSVPSYRHSGPGHTHRCGRCGTSWSHGNENVGNPSAHRCPGCGSLTWGNRTEGWSAPAYSSSRSYSQPRYSYRPTTYFSSGYSYGCPSGNCPR